MTGFSSKMRAAVVGVGHLGKFHAQKYAGIESVELVGVVDTDAARAEAIAEKVNTAAYTDYTQLFGAVDAVSIAAPTPLHYQIARAFLKNGVDVLIEKPITTTVEQADELIAIADAADRIIQVGHLERFNPAVMAVQDVIRDPVFIESNRLSLYQPRGTDVSVVHDLMIHDIDLILHFVESDIGYCRALGTSLVTDNVDIANAHIEFENGAVANVTASRISSKSERKIRLFQKDGYIAIDFAGRSITHIRPDADDENCPIPGMHMDEQSFPDGDALENQIRAFVRAVEKRTTPEVTGRMGRDALQLAVSIIGQIDNAMAQMKG
ncbi:MAG: Gfo/Idh/MocA family oxidoreductase [Thermodesulfobacteriota bacterium]